MHRCKKTRCEEISSSRLYDEAYYGIKRLRRPRRFCSTQAEKRGASESLDTARGRTADRPSERERVRARAMREANGQFHGRT